MTLPPDPARPKTGAAPFAADELFFSRTDPRGVILAANPVFQRVADFDWHDLIGAPHKLIRHPDMPRAVFWLLWQAIQAGQPIGAYVLNRARDGLHYWVFASVTPIEGGYISVRVKPATDRLDAVEDIYAKVRAAEREQSLPPPESAALLVEHVQALGYFNYQHFMSEAILAEVLTLPQGADRTLSVVAEAVTHLPQLWDAGRRMQSHWGDLRYTLTNMRLIAAKLEHGGGPIDLMAQNYTTVLGEAQSWLGGFMATGTGPLAQMTTAARAGALALGIARIQHMALAQFRLEAVHVAGSDKAHEMAILRTEADHRAGLAFDALSSISGYGTALDRMVTEIRRSCAGLNSTRMMCKAEAARQGGDQATFGAIIDTLDRFQTDVEVCAEEMLHHSQALGAMIRHAAREAHKQATTRRRPVLRVS